MLLHVSERAYDGGGGGRYVRFYEGWRPRVCTTITLAGARVGACGHAVSPPYQRWVVVLMRSLERESSRFTPERVEASKLVNILIQVR